MSKTNENKPANIPLKPYTLKELAQIYGVSTITMRSWTKAFIRELGEKRGRYYIIPQVKMIFDNLGLPSIYHEE